MLLRNVLSSLLLTFLSAVASAQDPTIDPSSKEERRLAEGQESSSISLGEEGEGFLSVRLGWFDTDDSGDGNPFVDEDLTVVEPVIIFQQNVSNRLSLNGKFSYDYVSSASIDRLADFPQQSGASGDNYLGLQGGFQYQLSEDIRAGANLSYSTEYDYDSIGIGGNVLVDMDENSSLGVDVTGFFDSIDVIRWNGVEQGSDDRTSIAGTVRWYQIFDRTTHGEVGGTLAYQSGFLETPYNVVVVEDPTQPQVPSLEPGTFGTGITEKLDSSRLRLALFGRARKNLQPGTSVELGGRIYQDSWGITGLSVEPRLYQTLVENKLIARVRYRYYWQTEADDYEDHFTTFTSKRTQDSDLADFDSHTPGFQLMWMVTPDHTIDVGIDYVFRSDDLDQLIASMGWHWTF